MELFEVFFEIWVDEKLVQTHKMTAPADIAIANFVSIAQRIKNDQNHVKLRMLRPELIWDQIDKKHRVLENCIEIQNY